ncbi:MAG: hypothetical protein QXH99_04655 [Sulfolobales archaeon]|jgi:DNA-directed RNA polymerase subunit RPC12/RpoP|nr:hypothetical protein [Desulfurococcaceae archaeon]
MSEEILYKCWMCGRTFSNKDIELIERISCPYCSSRIIVKIRKDVWRRVKAI